MRKVLKKMIKESLLLESIDIFDINNIPCEFNIHTENNNDITVIFTPNSEDFYQLSIEIKDDGCYYVIFGVIIDDVVRTSVTLNSNYRLKVLSTVFSLIKYYTDKYNVECLEMDIDDEMRLKLYNLYFSKHFKNFQVDKLGNKVRLVKNDKL
jgi:hypothetical protein